MSIRYKNSSSAIILALGTLINEEIYRSDAILMENFYHLIDNTFFKYEWEKIKNDKILRLRIGLLDELTKEENTEIEIDILSVDKKGKVLLRTNEGALSSYFYESVEAKPTNENDYEKIKAAKDKNSFRINVMSELAHIVNRTMRTMKEKIE